VSEAAMAVVLLADWQSTLRSGLERATCLLEMFFEKETS
jgi:hypothetical protein